jgi:hypothetical protein
VTTHTSRPADWRERVLVGTVSPPLLIEPEHIIRVVGTHPPSHGRCSCCMDPFSTDTSVWVEHTTWGEVFVSSVCTQCAADPFWKRKELAGQ